jgi:hypothetical protein
VSKCSVCASDARRAEVDDLLQRGLSVRDVARQSGYSKSAVARHAKSCAPHDDREQEVPPSRLERALERLRSSAEKKGDVRTALGALGKLASLERLRTPGGKHRAVARDVRIVVQTEAPDVAIIARLRELAKRPGTPEAVVAGAVRVAAHLQSITLTERQEAALVRVERLAAPVEAGDGGSDDAAA